MGNNNVYGQGHFITPNKLKRPEPVIDQNYINIEKLFGKIEINTARAVQANDTIVHNMDVQETNEIVYYEK